jgi:signal transduction histidine kinase/PAS domain-containing protein
MHWQYNAYAFPLIVAALISATLAFYVWGRRHTPGAVPFIYLLVAVTEWSLAYALELGTAGLAAKLFWAKVQYLGIVTLPAAWLAFALRYTGRDRLRSPGWPGRVTRHELIWLAALPLTTLLLAWTNDVHGLIWSDVRLEIDGSFATLALSYGPWFWVHVAYAYGLLLLGTLLLFRALLRPPFLYRGQSGALLLGALAPWAANALYITGANPFPQLDLTPFAFTLTGVATTWGLFRFRLLDIVPIARDAVIEGMSDGVMVLDVQNRIVDLNPTVLKIIGRPAAEVVGQPAARVLSGQPDGASHLPNRQAGAGELAAVLLGRLGDVPEGNAEIVLRQSQAFPGQDEGEPGPRPEGGGGQRTYDMRISSLHDRRRRLTGRLVVLRDITERKRVEEALKRERKAFRIIAEAAVLAADIPDLSLQVLRGLVELLGFDLGTVRIYNENEQLLEVAAVVGMSEEEVRDKFSPQALDDPRHIAALVARTRQAIFAPDVSKHEIVHTHAGRLDELGMRSIIAWPILGKGQNLLGVIHLIARTSKETPEEEYSFFTTVVGMFATALERKLAENEQQRLMTELRASEALTERRSRQLALLNDITRTAMSTLDVNKMLQTLAERLSDLIGADDSYITLWDATQGRTVPAAASDNLRGQYKDIQIDPHEQTMTASVLRAGISLAAEDVFDSPYISPRIASLFPQKSLLGVPLQAHGRPLGAALIAFREMHRFTDDEIQLCEQAGRQISIAIERAQLVDELQRHAQRLALVNSISGAISASLDLDQVLQTTVEKMALALDVKQCGLVLSNEACEQATVAAEYRTTGRPSELGMRMTFHGDPLAERVGETKQPLMFYDAQKDPLLAPMREVMRQGDVQSLLMVPLISKGCILGIVRLDAVTTPRRFTPEEIELAQTIANQASSAIENARSYALQTRAKAQLEELNRLKTDFLSTAAHELRTPLTSIRGFSEILLTRQLDPERLKRYLTLINAQSTQLSTIIDDLLDISRLEAGRGLEISSRPIDVAQVLNEALTPFIEAATRHQIRVEAPQAFPAIVGDPFRLAQVGKNLLSNAIKYSPAGGTITVRSRVIPGFLEISVQDEGIGMTPEQQAHLFEKFYRADASNASIRGTGLGLVISKAIVELHGGAIWVESQHGVGTTVYFTLPLADAPSSEPQRKPVGAFSRKETVLAACQARD